MFKTIKYTSDIGIVTFGGGQHASLRVRSISGLSLVQREYDSTSVSAGQRENTRHDLARAITIGADLIGSESDLENFERIVYADGILEFDDGEKARRIHCKLGNMSDPDWKIRGKLASFAIQFTCDDPYFEDAEATVIEAMTFTNNVIDSFTLPCVFTSSVNSVELFVHGIKSVYPIVHIGCAAVEDGSTGHGIKITNQTTGNSITLYHDFSEFETVEVNLKERTITSSIHGNILNSLSDDSDMEKFYLAAGTNVLITERISEGVTLYAQIEYRSEYVAAEY